MPPQDRLVKIVFVSEFTAQIRTSAAGYLLEQAGLPRQYDATTKCWLTSRRSVDDLLAWLDHHHRPAYIVEALDIAS